MAERRASEERARAEAEAKVRAEEARKIAEEEERRIEEEVRKKLEAEEKAKEEAIAVRAKIVNNVREIFLTAVIYGIKPSKYLFF